MPGIARLGRAGRFFADGRLRYGRTAGNNVPRPIDRHKLARYDSNPT
jgi:hypothetical protein